MKKNYFKKSLSLVMAVLMVMSCWVWIAPEQAEAYSASDVYTSLDDIKNKNNTLLGQVTGNTTINETYDKYFPGDSSTSVSDTQYQEVYNNVLWSDVITTATGKENDQLLASSDYAGLIKDQTVQDSGDVEFFMVFYPETVLMYDGEAPKMGVSIVKDANNKGPLYHFGTEISSTKALKIVGNWHTKSGKDQTGSWSPALFAIWNGGNTSAGGNVATVDWNSSNNHAGEKNGWYTLSNIIEYVDDGTLAGDTYYRVFGNSDSNKLTFKTALGRHWTEWSWSSFSNEDKYNQNTFNINVTNTPIYVIKVDTLKAAYKQVDTLKSEIQNNPQKYTPASVEKFVELANALTAANPNKYTWSSNTATQVSNYASAAKKAVDAWNDWYKDGKGGLVEIKEIKWNDGDGNTIKTEYRGVDQTATYSGATPTKTPDPTGYYDAGDKGWQYTYTFNNTWTKAESVDSATKRKIETHTANFDRITNFYVVTYKFPGTNRADEIYTYEVDANGNAHIPKDEIPPFTGKNPEKEGHYNYSFYWSPSLDLNADENVIRLDMIYTEQVGDKKAHEYGEWEGIIDSTCKEEGSKYQTCTVCGYVNTEVIEKKSHNLTKVEATESTCTVQGNFAYWYCSACDSYYSDEKCENEIAGGLEGTKLSLAEHAFANATVIEGDEVNHTLHCKNEGCTATKIANHEYRPNGMASTATCVTPGRTPMRCVCGMTILQDGDLDPNNHENIVVIKAKAPTCDDEGYTGDKVCLACDPNGDKILEAGEEIPALGHKFDGDYVSNNNGTHVQKCKNANCTATGNLKDCTYSDWTTDNADTHSHTCTACNYTPTAEPHNWSAWTPVDENAATASKMTHKCTVCGRTETIDCTNYEVIAHTDANCVDAELTTYKCKDCGHTYKVTGEPATGHKFDGDYVSNENGTHVQKCTNANCDVTGNKQNCTYGDWTTDNATTHSHTCTACGYTPAAENHSWTAWTPVDKNAATAGDMTRECTVCGRTETTDCAYDSVYTAPTCVTNAYTTYTCTVCGHGYTVSHADTATGHKFTGEYKFDANADKHQQLCANGCGTYGVGTTAGEWADCSWSYENIEAGKHTATCVCGNKEEQTCSGGQATCTAEAECQFCHKAYGEKSDHSFTGTVVKLEGDFHAFRCVFCKDENIYGVGAEKDKTEACSGGSATCTILATCTVCGDTHGQLDADAHKWSVPPLSNGDAAHTHTYTCEYNNEHKKTESCTPEVAEVVEPTCEEAGHTVQKCTACGATWKTDPTEALGHSWGAWANNGNGTHTKTCERVGCCYGENGAAKTETAYCTKENATVVVTAPTCTEQGFSTYTCKDCGYVWVADYVDALGHDYTKKIYREEYLFDKQNCTQGNIYFFACSRCGKNGRDETDTNKYTNLKFEADKPLGHKWVEKVDEKYWISDATCITAAKYYKSCEVCGEKSTEIFTVTEAFGHNWVKPTDEEIANNNALLAVKADCETDAQYYYVCELCRVSSKGLKTDGETWTVVSDKPGHSTLIKVEGVAGDCENDTIIAHYYCEACGKKFKDANAVEAFVGATVIKAPGHSWVKYSAVDATCETDGHDAYDKCSVCGTTKGNLVTYPKKGHNFTADAGYYVDEVNDYHAYYCANAKCLPATDDNGEAIKDAKGRSVYNKAYGAVVNGEQVKYAVTDNGDGTVTVSGGIKCSFDNSTVTTVNGVHSHNDVCVCGNSISIVYTDETPDTVAPTCVDYGYKLHSCPVCNAKWKTDMVEPNGHTWSTVGTSNGDGTHSLHCTVENCGYKKDTVRCEGGTATCKDKAICDICGGGYGDTLPHTLSDSGWSYNNDAKCGKDGTESQACSVCQTEVTRTKAGSALSHVYLPEYTYDIKDWANKPADFNLTIKEPNCKENGLAINYCTNDGCGHYNTKIVKASSIYHKITEITIAGTCTTGAKTIKSCSVCDYTETITSQASDHKWTETSREVPDCINSGAIHFYCTACGETAKLSSFTVDFTDSDYVMFKGMEVDISGIKALGHQWGNLAVDKAPTCSREGRGEHTCNVCKKTETVNIAPIEGAHIIGHKNSTLKKVPASAPTCVLSGNREYYECMSCPYSQNANDEYYLKPLNHKDGDGDGRCDNCYDPMDKAPAIKDNCICHKSGFSAFIYKILRVFWKLFKMKPTCECGAAHY